MFSWVGIACRYQGYGLTAMLIISVLSGLVMMVMVSMLYYFFRKMKGGEPNLKTKVFNSTGEVIQDVGRKRTALGKVLINIDGIRKEMNALTDFDHDVKKGTKIEVESVNENGVFIIKPLQ
jgi:hypothetical protein